ncbi:hypothetical protein ON010_g8100 [Phytophthora cinnamomi]|nr:hypothetical protein ON010_g8100 [Phytophthora cinnamomi]
MNSIAEMSVISLMILPRTAWLTCISAELRQLPQTTPEITKWLRFCCRFRARASQRVHPAVDHRRRCLQRPAARIHSVRGFLALYSRRHGRSCCPRTPRHPSEAAWRARRGSARRLTARWRCYSVLPEAPTGAAGAHGSHAPQPPRDSPVRGTVHTPTWLGLGTVASDGGCQRPCCTRSIETSGALVAAAGNGYAAMVGRSTHGRLWRKLWRADTLEPVELLVKAADEFDVMSPLDHGGGDRCAIDTAEAPAERQSA